MDLVDPELTTLIVDLYIGVEIYDSRNYEFVGGRCRYNIGWSIRCSRIGMS